MGLEEGKTLMESHFKQVCIPHDKVVTVTQMNHIIEIQYMEKMNTKANIKKLSKDSYVDLKTGELKEFKYSENRGQNFNSLRQTFKKIRYLINNNFIGEGNELHVTLTYKENMQDTQRLYYDFDKFMKRLRYEYKNTSEIDYISIVEPQDRGAWHYHVLLRFNNLSKIFISNTLMGELWGYGYVKVKRLKNVDNIGAYLSAYLTDIEFPQKLIFKEMKEMVGNDSKLVIKKVDGKEKVFLKGARLYWYPPGMNLYRKSKGIKYPKREKMMFERAKEKAGSNPPHFSKSYKVDLEDFQNTISYLQYNLKRPNIEQ